MTPEGVVPRGSLIPKFTVTTSSNDTGRDLSRPWTRRSGAQTAGISGMWFPDEKVMLVDNRRGVHHNTQLHAIHEGRVDALPNRVPSRFMPWATSTVRLEDDGREYNRVDVEVSRSAGGGFQALHKLNLRDEVNMMTGGNGVEWDWIYPVAYSCRLLDIPRQAEVYFKYEGEASSVDPAFTDKFNGPIGEIYDELLQEGDLPDPLYTREYNKPVVSP